LTDVSPPGTPSGPPSQVDELGARLQAALGDAYSVEGRLGAGGFAVVFLVRDVHLKRKLAVKVLSPDVIASHSVLERFRREAETIAQLSHPHIVPLHFIGQKDDLVYLVMEAVEGGSLADRLQREKRLPIDDAARIFSEVASALAHAHKRGVVHRDIKPQNVLLDAESGRALVTDFGIARTAEGGSLTATGMVVGTPAYLSPEQVTGEPSDHRADIYALGVMMYEMVAGEPPFTGPTPTAVLMKRLGGPPPPLKGMRADVPQALEELVDACLQTDPADRIQNAADITRALTGHSPVSGGHTTSTGLRMRKKAARPKSTLLVIGAVSVVIVGAVIAALTLKDRTVEPPVVARPAIDSGMVLIPTGTYTIGSNTAPALARAAPAHAVTLSAFGIDKTEVTVGDFRAFIDATGQAPSALRMSSTMAQVPITGVIFSEAVGYCRWRHGPEGRLPTEQEWEAAARGSEGRLYPWGNAWDPTAANVNRGQALAVAGYPNGRTKEGLEDMIGNVWEWTSSPYRPYTDSTTQSDSYVIRGGAYNSIPAVATAVFRARASAVTARENLSATGFRCAMTPRVAR
jgi:formylglycine-generating enzyme required for sulfatase activity/tRNA A-37 threonylcarbamoyl transferase component Bud32